MKKIVRVYHSMYGCDTGCCGHIVEVAGEEKFTFDHPNRGEDQIAFAKQVVAANFKSEHIADLDWDNAEIELQTE